MKKIHKILVCIMITIASAIGHEVYAQLPSSGTHYLTQDITLTTEVSIGNGKTLTLINNTEKDITISGGNVGTMFTNSGTLIMQGNPKGRIIIDGGASMSIDSTTIEGITYTVPTNIKKRIAIYSTNAIRMEYVTIQNVYSNKADGAALYLSIPTKKEANLINCIISKCYAQRGSAIMISSGSVGDIHVKDSKINCCFSGGGSTDKTGGAIRTYGSTKSSLYLENVKFRRNRALRITGWNDNWEKDGSGGAIFWNARGLENTKCSINGCLFENNASDDNGGAIKTQASIEFVGKKTYIKNNVAPVGAGLYIEGYIGSSTTPKRDLTFDLSSSLVVTDNRAPEYLNKAEKTISGLGAGIHLWFSKDMDLAKGSRIFVTLNGATIERNIAEGPDAKGGGIYFENSAKPDYYDFFIFLNDGKISNNTSSKYGGGVYVYDGNVSYDKEKEDGKIEIKNNHAAEGAGIFIQNGDLTILNGEISSNRIENSGNGAGVHINTGGMTIEQATISSNSIVQKGNGGGIYIENGNFTINAGEISGNTVSNGNGGGVYIVGSSGNGNFTMDGKGFINGNSASGNSEDVGFGGGIYVNGGNFTLTQNAEAGQISTNTATKDGGGVYINGGQFVQNAGAISNNTSGGDGGGVCIVNGGTFTMSGGSITLNGKEGTTIHTQNGGGVYLNGGNFVLENGTISNNGAAVNGGGVFLTGDDCTYELKKGNITGNSAGHGGGVYLENGLFKLGTSANPTDGNISNNTAGSGGGVYIGSSNASTVADETPDEPTEGFIMYGGTITGNSTTDDGGGIYLNGGSFLMNNGEISNNSSSTDGGGVCIANNGNFTMNNGYITGNGKISGKLTTNGGGVYLDGGTLTVNAGNISENAATASGGGVYISNGNVGMTTGKILSNECGEFGGGVYVYNPPGSTSKTVSVTGGSLLNNTANYGGGICVNGLIELTIGNVEIAENTATNGGGVCLMNNADMTFGAGQIKNNKAVKSTGSATYIETTAFEKDITEVEGIGGGIFLNTNTTLEFSEATELGLFGNTADNAADEIFANGSGTSVLLPNVTGMKLDGYPGAGNLKWIEDYITNDTGYGYGTKLKGDRWDDEHTNIRYRNAISNNDQDNIFNLERGTTENERTKYICFALGYEIIYITITRYGLEEGENAIYTLSKTGTQQSENFSVILTGNGNESISTKVAVTAGEWTVKEELWNWAYDFTPINDLIGYVPDENNKEEIVDSDIVIDAGNRLIKKNIAKTVNRNFVFEGSKKTKLPMNDENIVINIMGN